MGIIVIGYPEKPRIYILPSSMLRIVISHSNDSDSQMAIEEIIEDCLQKLDGSMPKAGILIAAPDYEYSEILEHIYKYFPELELIGGSSHRELSYQEGFQQDSLILSLFVSDDIEIFAGVGQKVDSNPQEAVEEAIQIATKNITQEIKLCITFPDGIKANGSLVTELLNKLLSQQTLVFGASTGEHLKYDITHQFYKNQVLTNSIPILIFAGDLQLSSGVSNNWHTIGTKGVVTKSEDNILYEIDHQPASSFYRKYYDDLILDPVDCGLAVFEDNQDDFYIRTLNKRIDANDKEIVLMGDIPQGACVQLTEANRIDLLNGVKTSISNALNNYPGNQPELLLCFSCAARRLFLGQEVVQEWQIIKSTLPEMLPFFGFYCYGEIAPLQEYGKSSFHNYTLISLVMGTN